jgi:hypothetical protein
MANLTCPQCNAPLSNQEVNEKCASSVHLYKVAAHNAEATPQAVVIQCPNGHLVEVECPKAQ